MEVDHNAKAEKYKNMGNDQFKKQNYQSAIQNYTEAIGKCNFTRSIDKIKQFYSFNLRSLDLNDNEPAYYTNRAIAYLKIEDFERAKQDCQLALNINPNFAKAYNRLSKCSIGLGDLYQASIKLLKSIELDPANVVNKKDQKHLADLKIVDTLVKKAIDEKRWESAVTNLGILLKDCVMSIDRICLKIECQCRAFLFAEANQFSAQCMKKESLSNSPKIL